MNPLWEKHVAETWTCVHLYFLPYAVLLCAHLGVDMSGVRLPPPRRRRPSRPGSLPGSLLVCTIPGPGPRPPPPPPHPQWYGPQGRKPPFLLLALPNGTSTRGRPPPPYPQAWPACLAWAPPTWSASALRWPLACSSAAWSAACSSGLPAVGSHGLPGSAMNSRGAGQPQLLLGLPPHRDDSAACTPPSSSVRQRIKRSQTTNPSAIFNHN